MVPFAVGRRNCELLAMEHKFKLSLGEIKFWIDTIVERRHPEAFLRPEWVAKAYQFIIHSSSARGIDICLRKVSGDHSSFDVTVRLTDATGNTKASENAAG